MKTNKAIILAAGMSSRMKKVQTDLNISERLMKEALNKPKSMIGLGPNEEPFLIYLIWEYYKAGIRELCLVLNERDQFTEDYFSTERVGFLSEIKLFFAYQRIPEGRSKPMGTAEALEVGMKAVPHWAGHSFICSNSDNLYYSETISVLTNSEEPNAMVAYHAHSVHEDQSRVRNYALLKIEDDALVDIVEKPDEETYANWGELWVSMNIWKLSYSDCLPVLEQTAINPKRNEKELPESMRILASKTKLFCYYTKTSVPDLTSQSDIENVQKIIKNISF